ncbi:MAG TPA: dephospho-CoA kinase [Ignavibacteriaceae bacterium]|nr:dephospho-CoA kinase [Ignavibacteriaceae bacterium]
MGQNKLKIAITGNIGSGKSAFANFIEEKGFPVIKADDISKEILANDENVKREIIETFGGESFMGNEINKEYLAEKVFSNPEKVFIINSILHPPVIKKINELMNNELRSSDKVFVEAALIYEADMEEMFDYVILITAKKEIRFSRKAKKLTFEEFEERDSNQIPEQEKKNRADFIFENNGSLDELKGKAMLLVAVL